jgi:hypothetical protein
VVREVSTDEVMAEIGGRLRERLRERLHALDADAALADSKLLEEVERLLRSAVESADARALVMPDLLGDPDTWRLDTALSHRSHRSPALASAVVFFRRRVMMPLMRWLFEYGRDNFERQRRVNDVLFACVQELAGETARLRREVRHLSTAMAPPEPTVANRR